MSVAVRAPLRVGYITSRFPKLTETFVLYEILGLERAGTDVHFYPLLRQRAPLVHPEAVPVVERAHYTPFLSRAFVGSHLHFLRAAPRRYVRTLLSALTGTFGSRNFFVGAIGIFPKVVHIARLMSEAGVEHVHCHFSTHPALAGYMIRSLTGIPYSFTAQGSDLHVDRTMLCRKVARAAFVVAISEYNRELIVAECGPAARSKIVTLHSGVDTAFFTPRDRGNGDGAFRLLCVGTLHEVKGQTYLIEACRLLREAGVDVRCRFVGEGPDRAMLERQVADAGLDGTVEFLGARSRQEVAALHAQTDVLVTPSVPTRDGKREGIPIVIMEALASGLPVVASGISGIPEIVADGENGFLVPPRDPAALADAVRRLAASDELRAAMGARGREIALNEFDAWTNASRLAARIAAAAGRGAAASDPATRAGQGTAA